MKTLIVAASVVLGIAVLPVAASAQDYPPCSRDVTDKCTQTHEGGGWAAGDDHMRHHMMHNMRHHMRHHHHHHARHHHHHHKKG